MYQVGMDVPPTCFLEWFSQKTIGQTLSDYVPGATRQSFAWLVLGNRFAFPVFYVALGTKIDYRLGYQELQLLVGASLSEVHYHADRTFADGSRDSVQVFFGDVSLGVPLIGDGACFDIFKRALFSETEP
jgi:hypothetical protein